MVLLRFPVFYRDKLHAAIVEHASLLLHPACSSACKRLPTGSPRGPRGILLADELGYVEAFLGEHITDRNDKMLQSIDMMLAIRAGEPTCNLTDDYWTMSTERTLNEALVETAAAE